MNQSDPNPLIAIAQYVAQKQREAADANVESVKRLALLSIQEQEYKTEAARLYLEWMRKLTETDPSPSTLPKIPFN